MDEHLKAALLGLIEAETDILAPKKTTVAPPVDPDDMAQFWAPIISSDRYIAPSAVSPVIARIMLQKKMVTTEQLRNRAITF